MSRSEIISVRYHHPSAAGSFSLPEPFLRVRQWGQSRIRRHSRTLFDRETHHIAWFRF